MAEFRLSGPVTEVLVFTLLVVAAGLDFHFQWRGFFVAAVVCLAAYLAAWELARWIAASGYQIHDSMATTLAALVLGFVWYLSFGYDATLEVSRWVEVGITLGLMMEALMVCIALIGILTARQARPFVELCLALAAGLVPGLLLVPAVLLAGQAEGPRLLLGVGAGSAVLWFGWASRHLRSAARPRGGSDSDLDAAAGAAFLGALAAIAIAGATGAMTVIQAAVCGLAAVATAVLGRLAYDRWMVPRGDHSSLGLAVPRLAVRVIDRLPEVFSLSLVGFLAVMLLGT